MVAALVTGAYILMLAALCQAREILITFRITYDDEGWSQARLLVVLLDQAVHLPLPDLLRVLVDLLEHWTGGTAVVY